MLMLCYPRCSTCKKARAWLDENGIEYQWRDIQKEPPTAEELRAWHAQSKLPLGKFFNTSGLAYKALGLAQKRPAMTEDEQLAVLATDGLLVKRPLLIGRAFVLVGFKRTQWEETLLKGVK